MKVLVPVGGKSDALGGGRAKRHGVPTGGAVGGGGCDAPWTVVWVDATHDVKNRARRQLEVGVDAADRLDCCFGDAPAVGGACIERRDALREAVREGVWAREHHDTGAGGRHISNVALDPVVELRVDGVAACVADAADI